MKLIVLSDLEQKEMAVKAIVTAHMERDAEFHGVLPYTGNPQERAYFAAEWLSLCNTKPLTHDS